MYVKIIARCTGGTFLRQCGCRAVTLPRRETRWNLQGCPKVPDWSQPLVGRSSPYCGDMWSTYCCLTSFFPIVDTCLSCEDIAQQKDYGHRQRTRPSYQVDQGSCTYPHGRSSSHESRRGQLSVESRLRHRFLDVTADRRIKTRKNWVPASSDEDLVMRSKRQNKV